MQLCGSTSQARDGIVTLLTRADGGAGGWDVDWLALASGGWGRHRGRLVAKEQRRR